MTTWQRGADQSPGAPVPGSRSNGRPWDGVLFDLDGTLIDSVPLILDSFRHTFEAFGLPVPPERELMRGIGTPLLQHFRHYADEPARVAALIDAYREYNLTHHDVRVRAYPGVAVMLERVHGAGLRTAIVTSKNRYGTERGLRVTGLDVFVDAIVPSDEVVHPKPHPEPVERALALLGITAERAVFVGDSLHDLECGRAARVQTAAVLWGPFSRQDLERGRPDHWLETPGALTALALEGDAPSGEA